MKSDYFNIDQNFTGSLKGQEEAKQRLWFQVMFLYGSGSPLDSLLFNCQPETKYLQLTHQSRDPSSHLLAMEVFWVFWNQQKEKHLPPFTTHRHRHRHTQTHTDTHTHTHTLGGSSPRIDHQLRGKFCPEWCYPSHYHAGQFHILLRISPFPEYFGFFFAKSKGLLKCFVLFIYFFWNKRTVLPPKDSSENC